MMQRKTRKENSLSILRVDDEGGQKRLSDVEGLFDRRGGKN
jgi:hypothetical protein